MKQSTSCDIWDPKSLHQPTKTPINRFSYVPIYPVCTQAI